MEDKDPVHFLNRISNQEKREDGYAIMELMQAATGEEPKLWAGNIIGFGQYHYKFSSGKEGEWFLVGFTPRKQKFTLFIMLGFKNSQNLLAKLGKFRKTKSSLHINKFADVDPDILGELVKHSAQHMLDTHP